MITNNVLFYTQIGFLVAFVTATFVLYRLLVQQKDATIQLLRERADFLRERLADAAAQSPDNLAKQLAERIKILEAELARLGSDNTATREDIAEKELALREARNEASELAETVANVRAILEGFECPHCGAPMVERAFQSEQVEYRGRELDVDHEYIAFECGYELVDGDAQSPCGRQDSDSS